MVEIAAISTKMRGLKVLMLTNEKMGLFQLTNRHITKRKILQKKSAEISNAAKLLTAKKNKIA